LGSPISLEPVTLSGTHVSLRPLTKGDVPSLAAIAGDPQIWTYLTTRADSAAGVAQYVDDLLEAWRKGTALPFVITSAGGTTLGITRLKEICAQHRRATIGSWLAPIAWGTGANTESKRLLLAHAFESLGLLRIEFQADSENIRSRTALARLGIREEGVLRRHQLRRDGSRRDTVVFSVIADEWLAVRAVIDARLCAQM
jgi:N-acetyltransferase